MNERHNRTKQKRGKYVADNWNNAIVLYEIIQDSIILAG